jgi:hypothetical protein
MTMPKQNKPNGDPLEISIQTAVQEFLNLYHTLKKYHTKNNQSIDIGKLITKMSAKDALSEQSINLDEKFNYYSALKEAHNKYPDLFKAPGNAPLGKRTHR